MRSLCARRGWVVLIIIAAAVLAQERRGGAPGQPPGGERRGGGRGGPAATVPDDNAGFEALFDGKTLANWDGEPGFWRVEDGCIVGETTAERPLKQNTFLISSLILLLRIKSNSNFFANCFHFIKDTHLKSPLLRPL